MNIDSARKISELIYEYDNLKKQIKDLSLGKDINLRYTDENGAICCWTLSKEETAEIFVALNKRLSWIEHKIKFFKEEKSLKKI